MNEKLPIFSYEDRIVQAVRDHRVVVVAAETGAGKSTEVPVMLLRAGLARAGMIGVTEPRRVAAMSLAQYVAEQFGCALGGVIGYQISGERALSPETRIKYMTEGILLREMHGDPKLCGKGRHPGYDVVIVDEAHERGVNQDLILALLKQVVRERPDLKVVIMSATIDVQRFADYFGCSPGAVIEVPGRLYDVEVRWAEETPSGTDEMTRTCAGKIISLLRGGEPGDILAFMPDEKTIKKVCELVESGFSGQVALLPLYGNQAPDEQRAALKMRQERRVIVATNIAETSLTVDGVVHVVDSGLIKAMRYVSATMSALEVTEHSKAGCDQRKGRAGRTRAGICHRLYSEEDYAERDSFTQPEILRMSLDQVLLHLRVLGYSMDEILKLEFMDPPGEQRWREAEALLRLLNALDANGDVTEDGRIMERLAAAPMIARMLLSSREYGCAEEMVTIAAGFVSRSVFVRPRDKEDEAKAAHQSFQHPASDALTLLNVWEAWCDAGENGKPHEWARRNFLSSRALREIERNRDQMKNALEHEGIHVTSSRDEVKIRKAVASGLIVNLCLKSDKVSYTWQGRSDIYIHPGSGLFQTRPRMMVCTEVVETSKAFARQCTAIEEAWIAELIPPHAIQTTWEIRRDWSDNTAYLVALQSWQGTMLKEERVKEFPPAVLPAIVSRLVAEIKDGYGAKLHPDSRANNRIYSEVVKALAESLGVSAWNVPQDVQALLDTRLTAALTRLSAGARTLQDIWEMSLSLQTEDLLPADLSPELMAKLEAARQDLETKRRESEEEERKRREETEKRRAEIEAAMKPLREKAAALLERANHLARSTASWHLQSIRDARPYGLTDIRYCARELTTLESEISQLEKEQQHELALSELIWKTALDKFPTCPLCGSEWKPFGTVILRCNSAHDLGRLIPLQDIESSEVIGRFVSNNGDEVAEIGVDSRGVWLRFAIPRASAWRQKKFKQVSYRPGAAILPAALAHESQIIQDGLAELRRARTELESVIAVIKQLEQEASQGKVRKLAFQMVNGQAEAKLDGRCYRSVFQEAYPQPGETWICLVKNEQMEFGQTVTYVIPKFRTGSISDPKDLEELRALMREMHPGIPEELLLG